jgi:hypothetical protein
VSIVVPPLPHSDTDKRILSFIVVKAVDDLGFPRQLRKSTSTVPTCLILSRSQCGRFLPIATTAANNFAPEHLKVAVVVVAVAAATGLLNSLAKHC